MTDRRPGPPLFELLANELPDNKSDHDATRAPQADPAASPHKQGDAKARVASAEERQALVSAGVSRAERSAATMQEDPAQLEGGIHLSMSRVYLIIAVFALALVVVWAVAYRTGTEFGKSQMDGLITKPLVLPPSDSVSSVDNAASTNTDPLPSETVTQPPRSPAKPSQAVMTAQGYQERDPRVPGSNYLQLATLSTEQAADAVIWMTEQGMPVIGVPVVDSSVRAGNNPSRYTLYSLGLAVPGGGQFKAMESQRNQHSKQIATLGAQWMKERRGGSDFSESKTQWVKYN